MSWNSHWTVQAEAAKINAAQDYRRRIIRANLGINDHGHGAIIIDFGSGIGCQLVDLARAFPNAKFIGIDSSYVGLEIAAVRLPRGLYACQDLSFGSKHRNSIRGLATHGVCSEVLEHVESPIDVLRNIRHFLTSEGTLVVTVPSGPISAFDVHIGHLRHYTQDSLRQLLLNAGFKNIIIKQYGFPFFDLYRLLVVVAGSRLINQYERPPSRMTRVLMALLRLSFKLNDLSVARGFQLLAIAQAG